MVSELGHASGSCQTVRVVDSHTEGEPTRVVISGGPSLGRGSLADRAMRFEGEHHQLRSALLNEPRGFDAMVGALLCEPTDPTCAAGVIFFNTVGILGMCGHAAIGTAVTLAHLGRIETGLTRIETPVGVITVDLKTANEAAVENVESYRYLKDVCVNVTGLGHVTGDIAWGGNWFFLTNDAPCALQVKNVPTLTAVAWSIRDALAASGFTGADGSEIDHIEFFGRSPSPNVDGRNFVLCPGGAYDRSPCGTGTSAKLACLADDGALLPGEIWVQESIIGSSYRAMFRHEASGGVVPTVTGRAFVCAEATIHRNPADPYADGIQNVC